MILLGIFLLLYPAYMHFRLKQCYTRTRLGDGSRVIDFDQHSIKTNEANAKSEVGWVAIQFVREDKNVMMLYLAPAKFIMISKSACSVEQLNEIRGLFPRNIPVVFR
jgi:hypothetical protein